MDRPWQVLTLDGFDVRMLVEDLVEQNIKSIKFIFNIIKSTYN